MDLLAPYIGWTVNQKALTTKRRPEEYGNKAQGEG